MSKTFLDNNNNVLAQVYETTDIVANPTITGAEEDLTGLQVGTTKYKIPQGGSGLQFVSVVEVEGTVVTLDKTTQEIYEMLMESPVIIKYDDQDNNSINYTLIVGGGYDEDRGSYFFSMLNRDWGVYYFDYNNNDDTWVLEPVN